MKQTLYMETTEIPAQKTAAEITDLLVRHGATQIALDYRDQKIVGLRFSYSVHGVIVPFAMPVRLEPVFQLLWSRRDERRLPWREEEKEKLRRKDRAQAERVAWRQLLRWIQAQLALIDAGMVETAEVFLPYIHGPRGRTMFEEFRETGLKLLPAPEER
ncbi:MAG: hypothetical protein KIT09_28060 [Bryobacteraceae bacterium]|nr:hypothetical protein [Bryobacteraceae bacterium]